MLEKAFVAALKSARVAIVGDVMLDHYVYGAVQRISPEAPVPVLHVAGERHVLGGAANVAANVAALGARARLVGIVGDDPAADQLRRLLAEAQGIEADLVVAVHPTIMKTRYLGDRQQIVRVDREQRAPFDAGAIADLQAKALAAAAECDVIVLSDYGKGVLADPVLDAVFAAARRHARPVIVDPKRLRFADYRGATIITPNRRELETAVGLPTVTDVEAADAAAVAIEQSGAAILLTRSEKGMSLFRAGAAPVHLPTRAREVFDVSGAGDTVVAALGCGLGAGLPVETAMGLANTAAGIVVGKLGTAVCTAEELAAALDPDPAGADADVPVPASWEEAAARRAAWRAQGLRVGFANGCFDLLHPGHVTLLQKAAADVDRLIVAINSDASVSALKGPDRPVQSQSARAFVLAGLRSVDLVTVFSEPTPYDLIALLKPDVLFKGSDYTEDAVVGGDIVKANGGRVALIDLVPGHSTTALVHRARRPET